MSNNEENSENQLNMKIYDVPIELKNKYISMAKLDYDNKVWKVMEAGMERLIEERESKIPELEDKINILEQQMYGLVEELNSLRETFAEETTKEEEETVTPPSTFGEDDEELLERFEE